MQGIGQLLWKLREKEGIRQKQLCLGISSVSKYARIEADQQEIDFFLIDRIMGRLGKSVERLTYILPRDIYNIYELRQEIQQKICQKKWEEAKQCLLEYEKNKRAKEPLHQQFIEQEYAQIAWLRGKSVETVCEHLEKAIVQTMPEAEIQRKTGILSAEEYKLLLFRWEVCFGTDRERGEKELQELVEEIFQKNFERTERVKVIPYAALLIEKTARDGKADTYLKLITETALENLREEGKLLYMPEILEQYAQILEKENSNAEFIGLLRQERASLLELESDYKVSFKNYRLFDHVVRNFEIDAELIRRTRNAAKLTQEGLSEDICAQETLARIENGNQKPRSGNLRQMMEKMGRSGDRIETGIQVEEYETLIHYIRVLSELSGQLRYAAQKRVLVEVALVKLCKPQMEQNLESVLERLRILEEKMERGIPMMVTNAPGAGNGSAGGSGAAGDGYAAAETPQSAPAPVKAAPADLQRISASWKAIVGQTSGMFRQFLQSAVPKYNSETGDAKLFVEFADQLASIYVERPEAADEIRTIIEQMTGKTVEVQLILADQHANAALSTISVDDALTQAIHGIPVEEDDESDFDDGEE